MRYPEELKQFGLQVKKLREEKGISQQTLAYEVGIDKRNIQRIEKGELNLTIETLIALSKALEVNPGRFFSVIEA